MPAARRAKVWYDKHRKCEDGSEHEGDLELITWNGKTDDGEKMGWGAVVIEEAEDHKRSFYNEYGGDQERFFEWWPQGFRWTCCGCTGDMPWGCDHHGTGSKPCKCDFCVMGKSLPPHISPLTSQQRKGLTLSRGPDPRSHNPAQAAISEVMRSLFGMDKPTKSSGSSGASGSGSGGSGSKPKPKAKAAKLDAAEKASAGAAGSGSKSSSGAAGSSGGAAGSSAMTAAAASAMRGGGSATGAGGAAAFAAATAAPAAEKRACAVCSAEQQADGKSLMLCAACKGVRYCGIDCQKADWPSHKAACKELRKRGAAQQAQSP
ncbi:hypothetical protein CHLRE_08g368550v5 [Chlamydomonas reinhardtii]|uniref:MYND-type domain-containing protein n=1 Tax=Chlamydomonas reinhardtii TaxID=3055 RepID=A0A2K3DH15_CHLRE|nr:uncharacterized protein CHLRE_08g368550v5 [Chlamydomonas reinhardtii]PNW79834.1 hypothetical protein CHLRE_08g368550v5 [Chlamydomonas reinhardtii]